MDIFFKIKSIMSQDLSHIQESRVSYHSFKQNRIDLKTLSKYPRLQKNKISKYHSKDQDEIRRAYM